MKPGERIKKFRDAKGLTQEEFSEALGISQSYLAQIETGIRQPSREFLKKLNKVFKVPSDYILYSGTAAQWDKIEAKLKSKGLTDDEIREIQPDYLVALVLGGREEWERGHRSGLVAHDPEGEYGGPPIANKKLLDDVTEILEIGDEITVEALIANVKAFLRASRKTREKRAHPRITLNVPIDFEIIDTAGVRSGITIDASQMGLLIQSSHDMPVGSRIHLTVSIPGKAGRDTFRASAEIMWKDKRRLDDNEAFQYGVKFLEVLDEGHGKLERLFRKDAG
jgi:transcriptional regulator with XRE-family HTH domain